MRERITPEFPPSLETTVLRVVAVDNDEMIPRSISDQQTKPKHISSVLYISNSSRGEVPPIYFHDNWLERNEQRSHKQLYNDDLRTFPRRVMPTSRRVRPILHKRYD